MGLATKVKKQAVGARSHRQDRGARFVRGVEHYRGRLPKWTKGADCKSAGVRLRRFESFTAHQRALIAQSVEHVLGKNGVRGSSPLEGSNARR